MEVKRGYKQTELGEIGEVIIGLTYSPNDVKEYGSLVLRSSNIQDNRLSYFDNVFVNMDLPDRVIVKEGDLLICVRNGSRNLIGKSALIDKYASGSAFGAFMSIFRCSMNIYVSKLFQSEIIQKQIENNLGATINQITNKDLNSFKIPIPPLPEQTAIATALSDMDGLIAQTEKLIEKKKAMKQGMMQELLKPKKGWVTKKLGEIGEIKGGGVDKLSVDSEIPVRLVNYMDVFKRDFIYANQLEHWVTASNQKLMSCQIRLGDVFFTPSSETREDIALPAVAMEDIDKAVYSYHLVRFRVKEDWDLKFKAYIFNTRDFLQQAERLCEGSGKRYVLTLPKFRELTVTYPSLKSEQSYISNVIWDIDKDIELIETKLQKLKLQKQGMMQELLTGRIRLL